MTNNKTPTPSAVGEEYQKLEKAIKGAVDYLNAMASEDENNHADRIVAQELEHAFKKYTPSPTPDSAVTPQPQGDDLMFSSDEWIVVRRYAKEKGLTINQTLRQGFKILQCSSPEAKAAIAAMQPPQATAMSEEVSPQVKALVDALEVIAKMPNLPNPDRDADWKNCMKWASHYAREALTVYRSKRQ